MRDLRSARTVTAIGIACIAASLVASTAFSQQPDTLRQRYLLALPPHAPSSTIAREVERAAPSVTTNSPSAWGDNWGDGFIGAGYQQRTRYSTKQDGFVAGGFGLGDAYRYVGLEVDVASVSTVYAGFFRHDAVSFKVHRILPGAAGIAVGWENALTTHNGLDGGNSIYVVGSKVFFRSNSTRAPFSSVTLTLGAGDGRFRSERDVAFNEGDTVGYDGDVKYHRGKTFNPFASVGLRVAEPISVIADWYGQDLAIGVSVVPFARIPLVITPAITDVTRTAGDGARFTLGAGLGFSFASLFNRTHNGR